ncbi:MAG: bifunctional nuclease family protein [Bacteroidaceae bacterium]|nr:bifunctional nuclease family protein [Bacteroidaceae bacterium]
MLIELKIHGMAQMDDDNRALVLLREAEGKHRMLPVMTSHRRALLLLSRDRVSVTLPAPPSATDICMQMMSHFGLHVRFVRITAVRDGLCFCSVVGESDGQDHVINYCQAADGLIIAVTFRCPIYIDEALLELQYMRDMGGGGFSINVNSLTRKTLQEALNHAVETENYETASMLRDELRRREDDTDPKFKTNLDSLLNGGEGATDSDAL